MQPLLTLRSSCRAAGLSNVAEASWGEGRCLTAGRGDEPGVSEETSSGRLPAGPPGRLLPHSFLGDRQRSACSAAPLLLMLGARLMQAVLCMLASLEASCCRK